MYTLRFPFRLQDGQFVEEVKAEKKVGDLTFTLMSHKPYSALTISGFMTAELASKYVNNVWAGLMWSLLESGLAATANMNLQDVKYATDPILTAQNLSRGLGVNIEPPVYGLLDGASPAVYQTEKKMRFITGGDAVVTVTSASEGVLDRLIKGATYTRSEELISDNKFKVALELYGAYFSESSTNARFLTLIMALEALTVGINRSDFIQKLLSDWEDQAKKLINLETTETEEKEALNALVREMSHKKQDSIRSQIRRLVKTSLSNVNAADAEEASRKAVKLYDDRSTLVHTGYLPRQFLATAMEEAKDIVCRVLRSIYLHRVTK